MFFQAPETRLALPPVRLADIFAISKNFHGQTVQ
jgi:hypothetical protein